MNSDSAEKRNGPREGAVEPMDKPTAGYGSDSSPTPSPRQLATKRVAVFVDGFNLYHGLHDHSGRKHLWLDLHGLALSLLKPDQRLVSVNYFTARVRNDQAGAARQSLYISALKATGVRVVEGRFQEKTHICKKCGKSWRSYEEKESDVNLCVALMEGAREHQFDVALIMSGDSDMVPAVRAVRRMNQGTRLIAVFPPKRFSAELKSALDASFHLGAAKVRQAQLPDEVAGAEAVYKRPDYWA
jgi:uncharacterized LabA/DUF88 family protein